MAGQMIPTRHDVHVLDPLSPEEIERAAELVREGGALAPAARFIAISTAEPPRTPGAARRRAAEVITFDPGRQLTSEFIVDLEHDRLLSAVERDDVRPA